MPDDVASARSTCPSPFRSPVAPTSGVAATGMTILEGNEPSPRPRRRTTRLESPSEITRSWLPSSSKSATPTHLVATPGSYVVGGEKAISAAAGNGMGAEEENREKASLMECDLGPGDRGRSVGAGRKDRKPEVVPGLGRFFERAQLSHPCGAGLDLRRTRRLAGRAPQGQTGPRETPEE